MDGGVGFCEGEEGKVSKNTGFIDFEFGGVG